MKIRTLLLGALAVSLAACGGIKTTIDYNPEVEFAQLRTWDFMPDPESRGGGMLVDNDLVDARVKRSVETVMEEKGFERVTTGEPDFRIGYHLALEEELSYTSMNSTYGGGWGYGMYRRPYYGGGGMSTTTVQERSSEIGTVIFDIFEVESQELVWRGSGVDTVRDDNPDPRERQYRADEAVRIILDDFPPNG
jgi:hypothetical protein